MVYTMLQFKKINCRIYSNEQYNNISQYQMNTQIIVRIKSPIGMNRITMPISETFADLRLKISKTLNYLPSDIVLGTQDGRPMNINEKLKLKDIPIMKDGIIIDVRLLKSAKSLTNQKPSVQVSKLSQQKVNNKCTHPPGGKCLNCLIIQPSSKDKQTPKIVQQKKQTGNKSKCNHGPNGKCFNCTEVPKKDTQIQKLCQHGANAKCLHCVDKDFINDVAHISFDHYLAQKKLKCKGVHPTEVKCNNCLPPTSMRYKLDINCKNHQPYPKAMCNKCLPPCVVIKRQQYRHLDYVQFMNVKDMGNFVRYWVETKHTAQQRVGYLYGYYAQDPHYKGGIRGIVQAIYEPKQKGSYNTFEIFHDPFLYQVDQIAKSLRLERIGWIITQTNHDTFLSQQQVRTAARLQQQFFVTHSSGYPISNFFTVVMRTGEKDTGEIKPEVYMLSDQAQALQKQGFFVDSNSRKLMKIRPPNDKQILPSFVCSGKTVTEFQPQFLLVNIGHGTSHDNKFSIIKNADFPAPHRKEITKSDLKAYMQRYKSKSACIKYSDFNLLLYIAQNVDLQTALRLGQIVENEQKDAGYIDEVIYNMADL